MLARNTVERSYCCTTVLQMQPRNMCKGNTHACLVQDHIQDIGKCLQHPQVEKYLAAFSALYLRLGWPATNMFTKIGEKLDPALLLFNEDVRDEALYKVKNNSIRPYVIHQFLKGVTLPRGVAFHLLLPQSLHPHLFSQLNCCFARLYFVLNTYP